MNDIVIGIGEVLWDILPTGAKLGGAPANFAYHISQFGLESGVVSAIGEDDLGSKILQEFDGRGFYHYLQTVSYPTGTVHVEIDGKGIPQYDITSNVAWDNILYTSELQKLSSHTRAVCFGSLAQRSDVSRSTIYRFIESIPKEKDPLVVFDVNLRQQFYQKEVLEESLKRCNILKINDEELEIVARLFEYPFQKPEKLCQYILEQYNLKVLILTCGVRGSYVFTGDDSSFQPTPSVEVVDTVGAGDSFTATFIASLLQGKPIVAAHQRATLIAAHVCTQAGAMPILPEHLL